MITPSSVLLSLFTAVPALDDVLVQEPNQHRAKAVKRSLFVDEKSPIRLRLPDNHFRATALLMTCHLS